MVDPAREDPFIEPSAKWANEDGQVFFEVDTIVVDEDGTPRLGTFSELWDDRGPWISVPTFMEFLAENPDAHRVE
jgi:hypothetical protein